MATRQKTAEQRAQVEAALREALRSGALAPGGYAPSVREIAQQHGVSSYIAHQALQTLAQEGAFQGERGRGTLVGRRERTQLKRCLIVTDRGDMNAHGLSMQTGFEDRIAQLGGVTGLVSWEQLLEYRSQFPVTGVLQLSGSRHDEAFEMGGLLEGVARVRFANKVSDLVDAPCDLVSFDDFGGGMQATKYLLSCGHRRIAFLGLHTQLPQAAYLGWSRERERGWKEALRGANFSGYGLAFGPSVEPEESEGEMFEAARQAALELLGAMQAGAEVSAVVAANDLTALALLDVLSARGVKRQEWPVVVGFDNSQEGQKHGLTSLRLPWEEVGRAAADLLWARSETSDHNREEKSRHSQIAMRLIARLSCGSGWAHDFRNTLPDSGSGLSFSRSESALSL